jgi:hypothetical protein
VSSAFIFPSQVKQPVNSRDPFYSKRVYQTFGMELADTIPSGWRN